MRKLIGGIAAAWLVIASAQGGTIAAYTGGTQTAPFGYFFGQSFTTTNLVPVSDITFNFYSDVPPTTPLAIGTGFLLSQAYFGTPLALSTTTPGFLAEAAASGGEYNFGSAVTLQPSTTYYFYENRSPQAESGGGTYTGGVGYFSTNGDFAIDYENQSNNFLVQGSAVPEPSAYVLMGIAAAGVGLAYLLRRRRRALPAPAA